jgi:hypothetical protein
MARHVVGLLVVVLIAAVGCAPRSARREQGAALQGWQLIHPPEVRDERFPGGYQVQADAPLTTWHQDAVFATRDACESSKITRIDDRIDEARAAVGDQAKNALPVRRAVHARCVRTP